MRCFVAAFLDLASAVGLQSAFQTVCAADDGALGAADRAFRPHVTVARFRRPVAFHVIDLDRPIRLELQPPALYCSEQIAGGVRYRRLTTP